MLSRMLPREGRGCSRAELPRIRRSGGEPACGHGRDLDEPTRTFRGDQFVFVPWAQRYEPGAPLIVTARSVSPATAAGTLRTTIARIDPDLAITMAGTGSKLLQGPIFLFRAIGALSTVLCAIATVLAMAGLFGVLSHVVFLRTREMGIRIALGADRRRIFRLVLLDGLRPVAKGIVLGATIGIGARLAVRSWVVTDVSATEPLVFALVPLPFILAALVACYLPAARAARVESQRRAQESVRLLASSATARRPPASRLHDRDDDARDLGRRVRPARR